MLLHNSVDAANLLVLPKPLHSLTIQLFLPPAIRYTIYQLLHISLSPNVFYAQSLGSGRRGAQKIQYPIESSKRLAVLAEPHLACLNLQILLLTGSLG